MQCLHFYFITQISTQLLIASTFLSLLLDLLWCLANENTGVLDRKHWNLWLGECATGLRTVVFEPVTACPHHPHFFFFFKFNLLPQSLWSHIRETVFVSTMFLVICPCDWASAWLPFCSSIYLRLFLDRVPKFTLRFG